MNFSIVADGRWSAGYSWLQLNADGCSSLESSWRGGPIDEEGGLLLKRGLSLDRTRWRGLNSRRGALSTELYRWRDLSSERRFYWRGSNSQRGSINEEDPIVEEVLSMSEPYWREGLSMDSISREDFIAWEPLSMSIGLYRSRTLCRNALDFTWISVLHCRIYNWDQCPSKWSPFNVDPARADQLWSRISFDSVRNSLRFSSLFSGLFRSLYRSLYSAVYLGASSELLQKFGV